MSPSNKLGHNSALHITSYLSTALSKILPHSKTIKNAKKLSVFGENNSRRLSNFFQTHILWKFDHISRIYNQINYRNIWSTKVTAILLMMAQVPFFDIFFKKDPQLNAVENPWLIHRFDYKTYCYKQNEPVM